MSLTFQVCEKEINSNKKSSRIGISTGLQKCTHQSVKKLTCENRSVHEFKDKTRLHIGDIEGKSDALTSQRVTLLKEKGVVKTKYICMTKRDCNSPKIE